MRSANILVTLALLIVEAAAAPLAPRAPANDAVGDIETPVYIPAGNRMVVTRGEEDIETPVYIPAGNRMVVTRDEEDIETPVYIPAGNTMVVTRDVEGNN